MMGSNLKFDPSFSGRDHPDRGQNIEGVASEISISVKMS
jgi:hypothetical protein